MISIPSRFIFYKMQRIPKKQSLKNKRMDEQELMRLVQEGNEMAFAKIMNTYKNKIVNFLWQLTHDYEKSAELAQETFMRVYFKANKYKPIAPLSSWIYAIASNLAMTELKKTKRIQAMSLDDVKNHLAEGISSSDNPASSEMIKNLREALNSLHTRYKLPLILKDIEGFSQEEIAQILRKPVGTIKARISRGRAYLKKELEKESFSVNSLMNTKEYHDGRC